MTPGSQLQQLPQEKYGLFAFVQQQESLHIQVFCEQKHTQILRNERQKVTRSEHRPEIGMQG
jgi:hypothetical protein